MEPTLPPELRRMATMPSDIAAEIFARAIAQSPLSTVVYDAEGYLLVANEAFERMWGVTLETAPARYNVLEDEQLVRQGAVAIIRRAFEGDAVVTPPVRYDIAQVSATGEGRVLWTEGHFFPIRDEDGRITHVMLVHVDLTVRMQTQEALHQRTQQYEHERDRLVRLQDLTARLAQGLTADEIADVILTAGLSALGAHSGVVCQLASNDTELEIVRQAHLQEHTVEEFRRFPVAAPLPLSDAVRRREPIFLESRGAVVARYPLLADANARTPTEAWVAIPLIADGTPLGGLAFGFLAERTFTADDRAFCEAIAQQCAQSLDRARLYDAERTARARAEESERRFRTTADAAPVLMWTASPDGITDWFNKPWLAFTGRSLEDALVDGWSDVHPDDLPRARSTYQDSFSALRPFVMEYRLRRHDGEYRWVIDHGVPRFSADNTFLGFIGSCLDITDRKRAEEALAQREVERQQLLEREQRAREAAEQANRTKSDFLTTMSHELRTPLNAIDGYAELLEVGIPGPLTPEQRSYVARIRRSQKHLLVLVNDVLSFARLESGKVEFAIEPLPVDETLQTLEDLVMPMVRAKGLHYEYRPAGSTVRVLADREKLQQIMLNLISNAVKFTETGSVTIAAEVRGAEVAISVRDTGRGIPSDKHEAIFEPFVQVESGLTRTTAGTGLGLAISRDQARRMRGEIRVESEVGRGATFVLTLPKA